MKHFGDLSFIRGILYYKISSHEQKPLARVFTHGLLNMFPRIKSSILTYLPAFVIGYGVYWIVEDRYSLSLRKNPDDYLNEVDPNPKPVEAKTVITGPQAPQKSTSKCKPKTESQPEN